MADQYDIAVIGGGVIGLALARELVAHDVSVVVVDAASETPPASLTAAGMLAPSFENEQGIAALYEFGAASRDLWPAFAAALIEETGIDIDFRGDGMFGVALDAAGGQALEERCAMQDRRGASVRMLTGDEARAMEPALSERVVAAIYAPKDAQVDPVKLVQALHASIDMGGAARIDGRVVEAEKNVGWRLRLAAGPAIKADQIVVATGAARDWFIAGVPRPPIFPVKGEAFSIRAADACLPSRVVRGPGAYLCPKAGGRMVVGATEWPHCEDLAVSAEAIDGLRARAVEVAPAIGACAEIARWAGLRPATPDGAPILGVYEHAREGVWLALGHHRNGILFAPGSANALAAGILGRPAEIDISAFTATRFG